jgi:D-serine deaminase-like pyridoxal phosphate-dependent protein
MKKNDLRSFRVALVPDSLINPLAESADGSKRIVDLIIELGIGIVQLPLATLQPAKAAIAIDYALDQLEDYAANGYQTLWLSSGASPADSDLAARIAAECQRRRFTAMTVLAVGAASVDDAARLEPLLRAFAQPTPLGDTALVGS